MHRRTWRALLAVASIALLGTAVTGGVLAAGGVKTYTGCLTTPGGTLTLIKEGTSPQKPCPAGSTQVRISGGDITGVTAGTGLTGGGTSGEVSVAIAGSYRLPQGCAAGKVAKWDGDSWECADDVDTTYTAGDGLVLDGTEFSLDAASALPDCDLGEAVFWTRSSTSLGFWGCRTFARADQSCATGKVVTGVDADGRVTCATVSSGSSAPASDRGEDAGIPDDGANHVFASVAGTGAQVLAVAKGTLTSIGNVDDFSAVGCELRIDGTVVDQLRLGSATTDQVIEIPFALTGVGTAADTVTLECYADSGADGVAIEHPVVSITGS